MTPYARQIPIKWGKLHCFTVPVIEKVAITPEVLEAVRKANEMIDFVRGHLVDSSLKSES